MPGIGGGTRADLGMFEPQSVAGYQEAADAASQQVADRSHSAAKPAEPRRLLRHRVRTQVCVKDRALTANMLGSITNNRRHIGGAAAFAKRHVIPHHIGEAVYGLAAVQERVEGIHAT